MDMRKLIDETDFDNLNELSKRWKKESNHTSAAQLDYCEQNSVSSSPSQREDYDLPTHQLAKTQTNNPYKKEAAPQVRRVKREVLPQIIDEDTEHFRNRLEHLLNGFKTDAVSEFMSMKKAMLEYQKQTIKGDTQKYLTMYEQKHKQLLEAKDQLIALTSDNQRKAMQIELMSIHIAKLNRKIRTNQYLSRPFNLLYQNKIDEQNLRNKMKQAARFSDRNQKIKAFNGWRNFYRQGAREKQQAINNQRVEIEVKDIVAKFQKETEMLRDKLNEVTMKNEEYEASKHLIQENLKKAFLRGISSMNMQAMGIFGSELQTEEKRSEGGLFDRSQKMTMNNSMNYPEVSRDWGQQSRLTKNQVIVNKSRVQSKDHRWKEAPIVGIEDKEEVEQPRPHLIKPTTQAKVIRVIDGKSAIDSSGVKTKKANTYEGVPVKNDGSKKRI